MPLLQMEQLMRTMQFVSIRTVRLLLLCTSLRVWTVTRKAAAQVVGGTISGAANTVSVDDLSSLNPSSKSTSQAIDSRPVKKLPLNGRLYDQFILLNPKTTNYNGQFFGVDTAREFNVVTSTYSAFYGKREGAQIGIVSTPDAGQLHGNVFEYLRNSALDARNYFDTARIPQLQRNDFGIALGAPVRKDKLFVFAKYEGLRQNAGLTDVTLVPDDAARAGFLPDGNGVENPVTINPVSAQLLKLWPTQNGPEALNNGRLTGIAEARSGPLQRIRVDSGVIRFDAKPTRKDSLFATYDIDDSTAETPEANPYSIADEALREQTLTFQERHEFSSHLVDTARFTFTRASSFFDGFVRPDIQAVVPTFVPGLPTGSIVISGSVSTSGARGVSNAGSTVGSNNSLARNRFTFDDHVAFTSGRHQIEAGIWLQRLQSNDNLSQDQFGQANFLSGTIRLFRYAPVSTPLNWRVLFADAYLQDIFHITPRLQVMAGFRSESSTGWSEAHGRAGVYGMNNGVLNTDPNVQSHIVNDNRALFLPEPRLGIIWDPFGNGKTRVRATASLFHYPLEAIDYRLDEAAPYNTAYAYSGSTVADATGTTPMVLSSTVDPAISTPSLFDYSLMVEQQVGPKTFLNVGYMGSHRYHQILAGDFNEPAYQVLGNGAIYYPTTMKANPQLASSLSWWSGGTGNYNAMVVDLRQNLYRGLQLRTMYTWSKDLDDGAAWNTSVSANTTAFVEVPSLPHLDYGPSATDVRNVVGINVDYELPFGSGRAFLARGKGLSSQLISGWSLGSVANLQSGFAFSPQLGYNPTASGDPRNPVRPDVNPNFTGRLYTHGTTAQRVAEYFNPTAFSPPAYGQVGDARRDSLVGPGHADWDVALLKSTPITNRYALQFRAEFFNVLNHTNLQVPNEIIYANGPAQGTASAQTTPLALGPGGTVTGTADTSRQVQFSIKLAF
jgi:hypothetical protein